MDFVFGTAKKPKQESHNIFRFKSKCFSVSPKDPGRNNTHLFHYASTTFISNFDIGKPIEIQTLADLGYGECQSKKYYILYSCYSILIISIYIFNYHLAQKFKQ